MYLRRRRGPRPGPDNQRGTRGFTLIELLLSLAVIVIMGALLMPVLVEMVSTKDLSTTVTMVTDSLRRAQSDVMSGRQNSQWGVHLQQDRAVLFRGAAYDPMAADNDTLEFSGRVRVAGVSLAPGGSCVLPAGTGNCDVHFRQINGVPVEAGTVTMANDGGQMGTITINAAGMTDYQ